MADRCPWPRRSSRRFHGIAGGDGADVGDLLLGGDGVAASLMAATTASVAFWMPRRMPSASAPAVTLRRPSDTMTSASSVAVVVPSPATSLVLTADLANELSAHVLDRILELDFLGDGHAVIRDERRAKDFSRAT